MRKAPAGSRAKRRSRRFLCASHARQGSMRTLVIILVVLVIGAAITAIGSWLIARAHPPRGRFIKIRRLRQHVVELGGARAATGVATGANAPAIVLIHGAGC